MRRCCSGDRTSPSSVRDSTAKCWPASMHMRLTSQSERASPSATVRSPERFDVSAEKSSRRVGTPRQRSARMYPRAVAPHPLSSRRYPLTLTDSGASATIAFRREPVEPAVEAPQRSQRRDRRAGAHRRASDRSSASDHAGLSSLDLAWGDPELVEGSRAECINHSRPLITDDDASLSRCS